MEEEQKVRVHGMWASTYSKRVEIALKIKGIPYDYVEEDLINKSQALLEYNPVHKKVPVLVHNGKLIAESLVILEYIDEAWPDHAPRLIPRDPYERAMVRFWACFLQNQLLESVLKLFKTSGEAKNKAYQEFQETMTLVEEEMGEYIPKDVTSFEGRDLGLLDIQLICVLGAYKAHEEVLGVKILDPEKHPFICSWVTALIDLPVIKDVTPPHDKIVNLLHMIFKAHPSP
ncbi:hypothetical protein RND81_13G118400 [Saponaria officinalis]|uniref:Glutathione S-transferase n=1 Tax=Saponaria officinalis TaxID=3572 RepID=A0AAW1GZN3_SAPOF